MKKMLSNFMIISVLISGCGNDENNTAKITPIRSAKNLFFIKYTLFNIQYN